MYYCHNSPVLLKKDSKLPLQVNSFYLCILFNFLCTQAGLYGKPAGAPKWKNRDTVHIWEQKMILNWLYVYTNKARFTNRLHLFFRCKTSQYEVLEGQMRPLQWVWDPRSKKLKCEILVWLSDFWYWLVLHLKNRCNLLVNLAPELDNPGVNKCGNLGSQWN